MVSQGRINSKGYHSLVPGLISIFLDGMGPFKVQAQKCNFGSTNDQKDNIIDQSGNKRYLL